MKRLLLPLLAALTLPSAVNSETYMKLGFGSLKKDNTHTEHFSTGASDPPVSEKVIGEINFEDGFLGDIAIGKEFKNFRGEISFQYHKGKLGDTYATADGITVKTNTNDPQVNSFALMAIFYKDFYKEKILSPYLGIGFGYSHFLIDDYENTVPSYTENVDNEASNSFAYTFKGGMTYQINKKLGLFGEISYLSPIDLRGKTIQSEINFSEIDSYAISTGVKITL